MLGVTARADWLPRVDFVLDCKAERVWPLLHQWDMWINGYRCEHVAGEPGKVGEIRKHSQLADDGTILGHYCVEVVRLIPHRRIVYRIVPLEEPFLNIENMRGYLIFNLYEIGDRSTLVTYESVVELESSLESQEEFSARWNQPELAVKDVDMEVWSQTYIPALQELLVG